MKKYLPHFIVASIFYFIFSIIWLTSHSTALLPSGLIALGVYVFMTLIVFFVVPSLHSAEKGSNPNRLSKLFFGNSSPRKEVTPEISIEVDAQESYRKQARIDGLKRDAAKIQDRLLRLGAVIGIALVVYVVFMNLVFGLTPIEVYFIAWPLVAVLWLIQIVFFPKWLTYTSFLVFCGLRFGIETIGPQVLMYLPNFIMLPFFYLMMMFFMFGSIMIPNLQQIKYFRPGEGNWEVPKGSTRGQFLARAMIETQIDRFVRYAKGLSDRKPTRGMIFEGPPGTGKTLYAKEIATELELPVVIADASAFNAPFMGFGQLIPLIVRHITEGMAREFGGAIVFIDEGEILFGARSGMQQQQNQSQRDVDLWDVLDWQNGDQVFDLPHIRTRLWNEQQMFAAAEVPPPTSGKHNLFMMPGGGGASVAIYPFLTWMSGTNSPPFIQRFIRSRVNTLLSALFIPVTAFGKTLRLPPGKPVESNVMFITATNRFFMFDPAMIRPGRFGIVANFVNPDEDERADIAKFYLTRWHKKGYFQDDLISSERIREFAQATPNASPAEIEQMIEEAVDVRVQHVAELRRLKRYADEGKLDELLKREKKFWLRFKSTVYDTRGQEITGWDDERVDWQALMETRSAISFGRANPEATNESTRRNVGFHEFGHFIALKKFNGKHIKPTLLTVIPRRGSLGMVAHIPHDTREMHIQEYYEGLIRTSVASWVTEHYFFGQNMPGVTGDLRNATNVAALMVSKFGMPVYNHTEAEGEYFAKIGDILISEPESNMFNPTATAMVESALRTKRKSVEIVLGMAAVDCYRLIRKNQNLFLEVIPEFLELDEFSGNKLADLWQRLETELVSLEDMSETDQQVLPPHSFAVSNPFYGRSRAEGADVYEQVKAITGVGK